MAGRIGVYVHSDNSSPDKGGALVVIQTQTDFASRTAELKVFADRLAMYAYGFSEGLEDLKTERKSYPDETPETLWDLLVAQFPFLEDQKTELEKSLGEKIEFSDFAFLKV